MTSEKDRERFMAKVTVVDSCWLWQGRPSAQGYGRFSIGQLVVMAHRMSYEMHVGPIPDGLHIDHLCRNRMCVNPEHLEPVTPRENTLRGFSACAAHSRKTHCIKGHALAGDNLYVRPSTGRPGRECRACRHNRDKAAR